MSFADQVRARLLPLGGRLARAGISADALTLIGLTLAIAAGALVAIGEPLWALALFAGSLLCDGLDGATARASGRARPAGAILDALSDRVGELALIAGIALAADAPLFGALAAGSAALPSYLRARAREVGIDALAGPLDRGGRGLVALIGLILAAASLPWALSVTLLVIAAGSLLTAARRARLIAQALSAKS
jgi:CDP-diacylglycerol--glycerol-3-phosphate 3-phosphatidyltransferase